MLLNIHNINSFSIRQLLKKENTQLESRILLMKSDIVDKDILEEMARSELGLFADNDILILPNIN